MHFRVACAYWNDHFDILFKLIYSLKNLKTNFDLQKKLVIKNQFLMIVKNSTQQVLLTTVSNRIKISLFLFCFPYVIHFRQLFSTQITFINCSMNSVIVVSLLLSLWVTTIDAEAKYLSMDNHEQIINDHQVFTIPSIFHRSQSIGGSIRRLLCRLVSILSSIEANIRGSRQEIQGRPP